MKKISAILLALCVVFGLSACTGEAQKQEVKSTEPVEIDLISEVYLNGKLKTKYEYDENGNETYRVRYDKNGEISTEEKNEYDEMNNVVHGVYTVLGETSESKPEYKYDKYGNILLKLSLEDGKECSYKYKYNKNGKRTEYIFTENGIVKQHMKYRYDGNGNKIKEDMYSRTGALVGTTVYEYDDKGNITLDVFSYNGTEKQRNEYVYDEKGNLIEEIYYDEEGEGSREKYYYDEKGNMTEWLSLFQGEFFGRYLYEYNDKNQLIKESTFENETDTEPNCIEEISYNEKGLRSEIINRNSYDKQPDVTTVKYITLTVPSYRYEELAEERDSAIL